MKKLIIIMLLALLAVPMSAQLKSSYIPAVDTLTDSETVYVTHPSTLTTNSIYAIAFTATELSGAATLTSIVQIQVEAGVWVDVSTAVTQINAGTPNAVSYVYSGTSLPCIGIRCKFVQTGTASTKLSAIIILKNP